MQTIVVGVDGSEPSTAALRFAVEEAALRKATLRVVSAWQVPPAVYAGGVAPPTDALDVFEAAAHEIVDAAVAEAKRLQPGVECSSEVVAGAPASALIDECRDAVLVVLGNRGRGGFSSLLLGSVSQQVVHHASCPVVIIPRHQEAGD